MLPCTTYTRTHSSLYRFALLQCSVLNKPPTPPRFPDRCWSEKLAARASGLAFGLALVVRPAGAAEAPALKGGSRRSFLRSGQKGSPGALDVGASAPDNARQSGPVTLIFHPATGVPGARRSEEHTSELQSL